MDKKCIYCKTDLTFTSYTCTIVRESVKPRYNYGRWKSVGYCCEQCESDGRPTVIESVK